MMTQKNQEATEATEDEDGFGPNFDPPMLIALAGLALSMLINSTLLLRTVMTMSMFTTGHGTGRLIAVLSLGAVNFYLQAFCFKRVWNKGGAGLPLPLAALIAGGVVGMIVIG